MSQSSEAQKPSPWGPNSGLESNNPQAFPTEEPKSEISDFVANLKKDIALGVINGKNIENAYKNASEADRVAIIEHIFAEKPKSEYKFLVIETALHDSDKASEVARRIIRENLPAYAQEIRDAYAQEGTVRSEAQQRAINLLRLEENAYGRSPDQIMELDDLNRRAKREQGFKDLEALDELLSNTLKNGEKIEKLFETTSSLEVKARIIRKYFSITAEQHKDLLLNLILNKSEAELFAAAQAAVAANASSFESKLKILYRDCLAGEMGLEGDKQDEMLGRIQEALFNFTFVPQNKPYSQLTQDLETIQKWDKANKRRKLEEEAAQLNQE